MRRPTGRLLAVVGSVVALVVGLTTPVAGAQQQGLAEVTLIHGLPAADVGFEGDLSVDVSIDGVCFLTNFAFGDVSPTVAVVAGTHDVEIRGADGQCGGPLAIDFADVEFDVGESSTIIAHIADGVPTASQYVDDLSGLGNNRSRVSIHHLADAPGVDVTLTRTTRDDPFFVAENLVSGDQFTGDTWIGDYRVELFPTEGDEAVYTAEVELVANKSLALYVVGSVANGTFRVIGDQRITTSESLFNGVFVKVGNSFVSHETGGSEVAIGTDRADRVGLGAEVETDESNFLYRVDVESSSINLIWDPNDPAFRGSGLVMPEGTTEIYRFTFAEPVLADVTAMADPSAGLVPLVEIISDTELVVRITEGSPIGEELNARLVFAKSAAMSAPERADLDGLGVNGVFVTVANRLRSPLLTNGELVAVGNRRAARVGLGREIDTADSGFAYQVDVNANSITMSWDTSNPALDPLERVLEAGASDYYLFTFAEPVLVGMVAYADQTAPLVPKAQVLSPTELLVEIGEGLQVGDGFDAKIFVS